MPGALSRLQCTDAPQDIIGDSFPDDNSFSNPLVYAAPRGPVLDGVLFDLLTPAGIVGHYTEGPLSALLTDTADRTAEQILTEAPTVRIIDDWQPDLSLSNECPAFDPEARIRRFI